MKKFLKSLSLDTLLREVINLRKLVNETMDKVEEKVEIIIEKTVKALVTVIILLSGLVFLLIGLAQFFESKTGWAHGSGLLIIGGFMVLLAILVKVLGR